jgi:chromosome segregation ATPase
MINPAENISGKVHELEMAMDKAAQEFQKKEAEVETHRKAIDQAKILIKTKEDEKRQLERDITQQQNALSRAQNELNALKREHDRHHAEFERFKTEYEAARRSSESGTHRKIA